MGDSKDAIYGALDAWVAWEESFPIGVLKNVLLSLEKEKQWHRVVQVLRVIFLIVCLLLPFAKRIVINWKEKTQLFSRQFMKHLFVLVS